MFVIGGVSIEGTRAPWATPGYAYDFWDKIAPLSSFINKNHLKQH